MLAPSRPVSKYTCQESGGCLGGACRVWRHSPNSDWQETWVQAADPAQGLQTPKEVMSPLTDPLITACLAAAEDPHLRQHRSSTSWLRATMDWVLASGHLPIFLFFDIPSAVHSHTHSHQVLSSGHRFVFLCN